MGFLSLPVLGTVLVALMAYWNGLLLSQERRRPANAVAGLLLTLIAIVCVVITPGQSAQIFARAQDSFVITGNGVVDVFILSYGVFASAQLLLGLARAETGSFYGKSDVAEAASWVNRLLLRGATVASAGYGLALLTGAVTMN
jgi:hypothetical protein